MAYWLTMPSRGSKAVWERFLNWQSDSDWTWGPLVFLRPPQDQPIRPWVWVRLFVIFTTLGLLLVSLLIFVCAMLPKLAASEHWPLPAPVADILATLRAMGNDPQARTLFFGLPFALPFLFFTFCLPYHWAWNRRASRLQKTLVSTAADAEGVWPPAPN